MIQKWLVLGGTKEARQFIQHWRGDKRVQMLASIAGVTTQAPPLGVETRVGGFSYIQDDGVVCPGDKAIAAFIREQGFHKIIDITHPFAAQISANARQASTMAEIDYVQFLRAPWRPLSGDYWHYHEDWQALFETVKTRHLFVAGGQEALSALPQDYRTKVTARMMEPPQMALSDLPDSLDIILGKPGASSTEEEGLFRKYKITAIAAKMSGGKASAAKLAAARALGLDVHLVNRPSYPEGWFDDMRKIHRYLSIGLSKTS